MKANPLDTYRRMLKASYRDSCHFACEDAGIHDPETTIPALVDALREIAKTASEEIADDLPHIAEHARAVLAKLEGGPQV